MPCAAHWAPREGDPSISGPGISPVSCHRGSAEETSSKSVSTAHSRPANVASLGEGEGVRLSPGMAPGGCVLLEREVQLGLGLGLGGCFLLEREVHRADEVPHQPRRHLALLPRQGGALRARRGLQGGGLGEVSKPRFGGGASRTAQWNQMAISTIWGRSMSHACSSSSTRQALIRAMW